jgi:PPOX class probable F420-dependent enzyme
MPMMPEEIDRFLAEPRMAHLATVDPDGRPRVRPVWYLWRDGVLWITTRRRVRHTGRDLEANPRVAASIASEERPYRAVVVHGRPEVLPKDRELLAAVATRYGEEQGLAFVEEAMAQDDRVLLKLVPEELISWDYGTSS